MKKFLYILIGIIIFAGIVWVLRPDNSNNKSSNDSQPNISQVAVSQAANGQAIIYDVRTPEEFATKHVDNAINFNVENMQQGLLPQLPKDSTIYVYCRSGNRSAEAKQILSDNGFTNVTDLGGLSELQAAGVL